MTVSHTSAAAGPLSWPMIRISLWVPVFVHLRIQGEYDLTVYDALTGDIKKPEYTHRDGQTRAVWGLGVHDSLLMRLTPAVQSRYGRETIADKKEPACRIRLSQPLEVIREEPNVLLLDKAAYRIDREPWQPEDS